MKEYNSNYLGMVVNNNDPEYRGRIQVFIPHIMPALYEGWNQEGKDVTISCVGNNMEAGLGDEIVTKLKQILPWAEAASPIIGSSAPGGVAGGQFVQSPTSTPTGSLGPSDGSLASKALENIGWSSVNCPGRGNKGCACTVSEMFQRTYPGQDMFPGVQRTDSTTAMLNGMKSNPNLWQEIPYDQQQAGDIVVTGAAVKSGHVGINVDGYKIASNSSARARFEVNFDKDRWLESIASRPGAPTKVFRYIGPGSPAAGGPSSTTAPQATTPSSSATPQSTTSTSAAPPAPNPVVSPGANPSVGAPASGLSYSQNAGTVAGTTSGGGTTTTGNAKLASDRNKHLGAELAANKELLLSRIQATLENEVGGYNAASSQAIIETMVNRAYFENRTLENVVTDGAYYTETYNKTAAPSELTRAAFEKVMSGGNMTNLATDAGFNLPNTPRAIKNGDPKGLFITGMQSENYKIQGVIDLQTGKEVTDQSILRDLYTNGERKGRYEFFVRQSRGKYTPDEIGEYAQQNGITSDGFTTDLDPNLSGVGGPSVIGNTYPYGRPSQYNTNDMASGLFAFPNVGAMVWVFFREGNPLYPVYFAASYSSAEWQSAYRGSSLNASGTNTGNPKPGVITNSTTMNFQGGAGIQTEMYQDTNDPLNSFQRFSLNGGDGSGLHFRPGLMEEYAKNSKASFVDGDLWNVAHGSKETWIGSNSNMNCIGNSTEFYGKWDQESMEASKKLADMCFEYNQKMKTGAKSS